MQGKNDLDMLVEAYVAVCEGKKSQAGARLKRVKDREGPAGMTSSPVGTSDYNPDALIPKDEPFDKGSSTARDTKSVVRYAFEIIGSFEDTRRELGDEIKDHHKLKTLLRNLGGEQKRYDASGGQESRNTEEEMQALSAEIGRRIHSRDTLGRVMDLLRRSAEQLKKKLEGEGRGRQIKDLSQLATLLPEVVNDRQLEYIKAIIDDPGPVIGAFERWYDNEMGAERDPLSYMNTIYKSAAIKSGLIGNMSRVPRGGSLKDSHSLSRSTAEANPHGALAAKYIKSVKGRYEGLDVDKFQAFLDDAMSDDTIDSNKAEDLMSIFISLRDGSASEGDLTKRLYKLNESWSYISFSKLAEQCVAIHLPNTI